MPVYAARPMAQLPLTFDSRGLVPVIVQDHLTGEVRMFAFATAEAIQSTRETGRATFWSRSRGELWEKGRTSGNAIRVLRVLVDCDADCVDLLERAARATRATPARRAASSRRSRARRASRSSRRRAAADAPRDARGGARGAQEVDGDRRATRRASTTPARPGIGAKLREEAGELAQALEAESDERVVSEAADVLYHLMVGLRWRAIPLRRVLAELARRLGTSGHEEKASRRPGP